MLLFKAERPQTTDTSWVSPSFHQPAMQMALSSQWILVQVPLESRGYEQCGKNNQNIRNHTVLL